MDSGVSFPSLYLSFELHSTLHFGDVDWLATIRGCFFVAVDLECDCYFEQSLADTGIDS